MQPTTQIELERQSPFDEDWRGSRCRLDHSVGGQKKPVVARFFPALPPAEFAAAAVVAVGGVAAAFRSSDASICFLVLLQEGARAS